MHLFSPSIDQNMFEGALDSISSDGSTNWGSAMMLILNGTKVINYLHLNIYLTVFILLIYVNIYIAY